jgi:hypothetical protein
LLHDLFDAIAILVEGIPVLLEVMGVERALHEFLVAAEPEVVVPRRDRNHEDDFEVFQEIAPDELSAVLDFFFTHAIPRIILPDDLEC